MKSIADIFVVVRANLATDRMCAGCGAPCRVPDAIPRCVLCQERDAHDAARRTATEKVWRVCQTVPQRFRDARLGSSSLERLTGSEAMVRASGLVGKNAGILGAAGSGKTTLAVAMLVAAVIRGSRTAAADKDASMSGYLWDRIDSIAFFSADTLADARSQHGLGRGEAPIISAAMGAHYAVIDDLGAERRGEEAALVSIARERFDNNRWTITTSGFTPSEIERRYGAGLARRLFGEAEIIQMGGSR